MRKEKRHLHFTLRGVICTGLALLLLVTALAVHREMMDIAAAAQSAIGIMKLECVSFNKLTAADRTKSMFYLSDMMRDLSDDLARQPQLASDDYLEQYVDSLRLSGVALLDENLELEASGYTRRFRNDGWARTPDGSRFADIIDHPAKVYLERLSAGGEFYDMCAVARKDAPGILVGFYRQPSGLITGTENDLETMLTGLRLEHSGHYAIAENGTVRVASETDLVGQAVAENAALQALSQLPKDDSLHRFRADGATYWGYRSGCENYSLYVYYPAVTMASAWLLPAAVFAAVYCVVILLFILMRNRALYEKQEELRKSNDNLRQTVSMLQALETIYFTLFYVDLDEDRYDTIYMAPWLQDKIPQSGVYTRLKQSFMDSMIVPSYCPEIDRRMSIEFIRESLSQENLTDVRKSFYTDYQAINGDEIKWCRVSAAAVDYAEDGRPRHVLALLQDIDQEKSREADYQARILKEAEEARIANNAKTEFLRRISHDVRTPINGLRGYIEMADKHPEDIELQAHCRKNASIALHVLLDLVNSVLDMSKMESDRLLLEEVPFDLTAVLDNVNTILTPQAEARNVRFEALRRMPVPYTHVLGSPRHVSQVIMNMTSNAVKYTEPGGYVRVDTSLVSKTDDKVTYEFVCADNGIGMSEEFQQRMFEPFTQEAVSARSTYEGVGLGLSIMKKLVDAMGGTVTCESRKGEGTTFRVQLTFKLDKTYQQEEAPTPEEGAKALDGLRILVAEDNELNMEVASCLLEEQGVTVTRAWNGREAVDAFSASAPGQVDAILMDVMMPEMNGLEATKAIRALPRPDAGTVPIVAMSANSFRDDIQRSLDAGMNAHLTKPVDLEQLTETLTQLLRQRGV